MGEDGDRAGGLAERTLIALVLEPVEPVADVGRQIGVPASDLGDPVGVLDDADRVASGVAVNVRCVPGDPCRLGREQRLGLRLVSLVEPVPASVGDEHEEHERERRDHRDPLEAGEQALATGNCRGRWLREETVSRLPLEQPFAALLDQLLDFLVALAARGYPDVLPLDPDEHRRQPPFAAELVDV